MAARDQSVAQLDIVENLAVESHADVAVRALHRLLAGRDVDDAQPCVAKTDIAVEVNAVLVRAAMIKRRNHALEQMLLLERGIWNTEEAGYPTHLRTLYVLSSSTGPRDDLRRQPDRDKLNQQLGLPDSTQFVENMHDQPLTLFPVE